MVWRKFGQKLFIREFILGIYSLIILVPACAILCMENDMDPVIYALNEGFSIKSYPLAIRLIQIPYCWFILGSAAQLTTVVIPLFVCGCVSYFWLTQEYPMNKNTIRFISLNHYRTLRILIVYANSCINNPAIGAHHATESIIIVCGIGFIFKDKLESGILLNLVLLCVIIGSVFCSFAEAYLDQKVWLASKNRLKDFKLKFASRKYMKPRLRGIQHIVCKTSWTFLEYFSMNDFMNFIRKCLDILLIIILVDK